MDIECRSSNALPYTSIGTAISLSTWGLTGLIVCLTPLIGLLLSGADLAPYLELPPRTLYVQHAEFSALWFAAYLICGVLVSGAVCAGVKVSARAPFALSLLSGNATVLLLGAWLTAWGRYSWAEDIQHHTYILLWIAYILLMNAISHDLHRAVPLATHTRRFLAAFPVSAVFWWGFEVLNRYTQNWHYVNVDHFSSVQYAVLASLSFSTVLPGLWATHGLLSRSMLTPRSERAYFDVRPPLAAALLAFSIAILLLLTVAPNYLFALIWGLPIAVPLSLEALRGKRVRLYLGNAALWAVAGILCGFFWELWNFYSLAKWIYLVPFVQRFHLFEMPIVGYAGYIPFGILCGLVIETIRGSDEQDKSAGD